jgi:hypothetical protein
MEPQLVQEWQFCYERSIGCIGTLKDWLLRSLAEAVERGTPTITHDMLERHALSIDQCDTMLTAALEGERQIKGDPATAQRFRERLKLPKSPAKEAKASPTPDQETSTVQQPPAPKTTRIQRHPQRDPVKSEESAHA